MSETSSGAAETAGAGSTPANATAKRSVDKAEFLVSGILVVIGVFVLVDALSLTGKFSSTDPIGPRAFPLIVAGGLFLTAALLAVNVVRGGHGEAEEGEDIDLSAPSDWKTVIQLVAVFAANIALVNLLGWVISGGLLFFGTAWVLGSRNIVRNLIISAVLALVTFYGFYVGLNIHLPAGILDGIL
jgi:putative tricarboxylic transport membrane protein